MADTDARIMEMVQKELAKDRSAATSDLYEKARKIDPAIGNLTARQFHAKYPLQVKRAMKSGGRRSTKKAATGKRAMGKRATGKRTGAKRGRPPKKAAQTGSASSPAPASTGKRARRGSGRGRRAAGSASGANGDVRGLLLQFAREVAQADDKAEMVDVLAGIDSWVDRMVAAAGK